MADMLHYIKPENIIESNIKLCVPRYQPLTNTAAYCFAIQHADDPIRLCTPACNLPFGSVRFTCRLLPIACDTETRNFTNTIQRIDNAICACLQQKDFQHVLTKGCGFNLPTTDVTELYSPTIQGSFLKKNIVLNKRGFTRAFSMTGDVISSPPYGTEVRMIICLSHIWIQPRADAHNTIASIYSVWNIVQIRSLDKNTVHHVCNVPVSLISRGTQTQTQANESTPRRRVIPRGGVPLISASALKSVKLKNKRRKAKNKTIRSVIKAGKPRQAFQMVTVELLKSRRKSLRSCRTQPKKRHPPGKPHITFPSFQDLRRKRIVRRRSAPPRPFINELIQTTKACS